MLIFCCVIIAVLIILDFIPIKFVCKLSEFENNIHENVFISEHTAVTGGDWYADIKTNPWLMIQLTLFY
ncbi:MAG: hypothetical protein K0S41_1865 [Anaerocolumna sp.]|jgi:hypothetical protein|nr:hypothetical protein [Anaerocolumna sp.]